MWLQWCLNFSKRRHYYNRTHFATGVAFKKCAPFTKCITKIDGIIDAQDLDLIIPMYNLLKYSSNYSDTTGSLWFYSKDEAENANIVSNNNFKIFRYKIRLIGNTVADEANGSLRNAIIAVALKCLSNYNKQHFTEPDFLGVTRLLGLIYSNHDNDAKRNKFEGIIY